MTTTNTTNKEIRNALVNEYYDRLFNDEDVSCETFCERCPLHGSCYDTGDCYSCGIWEEMMGDEL